MSRELPDGWVRTTLDQVALVQGGIQKQQKRRPAENRFPFLRVANVGRGSLDLSEIHEVELFDGELERFALNFGDLLVVEGNGSPDQLGRAAMWRGQIENCVHQNHLIRVRPSSALDPVFLQHLWNSPVVADQLKRVASSTSGLHTLSTAKLKRVEISLPPLAEQRRIVDALDDHLSRLSVAERTVKTTIQRFTHLRDSIVAPTNRAKAASHEMAAPELQSAGVVDGNLPMLPASWRWMRLGELADVVGGITKDAKKQADPDFIEVPYLRVANVQRGRLDLTTVTKIRVPRSKASQLALQHGDVLLNEGGDRDKLGRGWIWEDQIEHAIHQNHVFRARIIDKILEPKLLAWHANGFGRAWFEANGKQSVNLASISLKKIRMFPVPVPPADEQAKMVQEIEEQLSVLDNTTAAAGQALKKAAGLRRSLLTEAFSGRLVPQDQTDEPASELLARIRAERASLETGKAKPVRLARTTATKASAPQKTTTVPVGIQEELPL